MRKFWMGNKKILAIKAEISQVLPPNSLSVTENSYKIKETTIDISKDFQDTLNMIFVEKLPETTLIMNNLNNLLRIILVLGLIMMFMILGFLIISYSLLMLWALFQKVYNYWRSKKRNKEPNLLRKRNSFL